MHAGDPAQHRWRSDHDLDLKQATAAHHSPTIGT
jgi:hypothetical protein